VHAKGRGPPVRMASHLPYVAGEGAATATPLTCSPL
jgi:hypothetical protein